jgi:hypothetical protein
LYHNTTSEADNQNVGQIKFTGKNSVNEDVVYGKIQNRSTDVTDGTENAETRHYIYRNTAEVERLRLDGTGLTIWNNSGSAQLYTTDANVNIAGNLVVSSGNGIDFSATTDATGMSSELLDDYEEGGWTPNFSDGTTTVTTGGTRIGKYVKVGQMVTAWASISNGQTTGLTSTASLRITGLPFTGENANASERANGSPAILDGVSYTTDPVVYLTNNGNRDYVNIYDQGAGTSIKVSNVTSGTNYISFTLTYLAG